MIVKAMQFTCKHNLRMVQITFKLAAHPQRGLVRHSAALAFNSDTLESHVFHFSYTCHSHVLLSFTHLSLVGHLVSKVSRKLFIMECSGLRGQLLNALTSSLVFNNYLTFSPLCNRKSPSALAGSQ